MNDIIEHLEAGAEARYFEATLGLPSGKVRCGCGRVVDEGDMQPVSSNPYASPVCGICFEQLFPRGREL